MVGILLSYWGDLFSGAMLVSPRVTWENRTFFNCGNWFYSGNSWVLNTFRIRYELAQYFHVFSNCRTHLCPAGSWFISVSLQNMGNIQQTCRTQVPTWNDVEHFWVPKQILLLMPSAKKQDFRFTKQSFRIMENPMAELQTFWTIGQPRNSKVWQQKIISKFSWTTNLETYLFSRGMHW